jgi:prepilin-type N-terminal cleavage/methylation domain-containing protein/prepilin-type processing-associated H-X9-DG protein
MSPLPHVPQPVPESSVKVTSRGFTLIELLVVIAIVGVLAALALAAAGRFVDSGKQATTAGRLKQVYVLQMAYAQDNNGRLTPFYTDTVTISWQARLFPYLNLIGGNRSDPKLVLNSPYHTNNTGNQASFGLNNFMRDEGKWGFRILSVPQPSKIILAGDMQQGGSDYMHTSDGKDKDNATQNWGLPAYRHAGKKKAMMLFMDGHTELLSEAELRLTPADGSPSRWRWW